MIVDYAMRYGNPSIRSKIKTLHEMGCENLVILPLYPQYAAATTATVCDEVYRIFFWGLHGVCNRKYVVFKAVQFAKMENYYMNFL